MIKLFVCLDCSKCLVDDIDISDAYNNAIKLLSNNKRKNKFLISMLESNQHKIKMKYEIFTNGVYAHLVKLFKSNNNEEDYKVSIVENNNWVLVETSSIELLHSAKDKINNYINFFGGLHMLRLENLHLNP